MTFATVTVIVPVRNEAADIEGCLDCIAAQDYPVNRLEVIVVDGCSTDGTADAARRALGRWGFYSTAVISNEGCTASSNLNVGLARSTGDVVCRVDARTRIQPHYVRTCVELLGHRDDVSSVGGAQIAVARDPRARSVGIARALNNRWAMGGSRYRRATTSGTSDTVYLGAFRRADLVRVGGWDEDLISNQDFDLNRRLAEHGKVWFEASLRSGYLPRATLAQLCSQYLRFGRAKVRYWRHSSSRPQRRQWVLLLAPPLLAVFILAALWAASAPARLVAVVLLIGVALLVDHVGSQGPPGRALARAVSIGAMSLVASSWWLGVVVELLSPSRERVGSDLRAPAS